MLPRQFSFIVFALCGIAAADDASFAILPNVIHLARTGQEQRVLVERRNGGSFTGDVSAQAAFASSNPAVAVVAPDGVVRAAGDGEATITATVDGKSVQAAVKVAGAAKPFTWSFRNHIEPLLYKAGCSTGPCHGAQAGKNGFKLSLRGFDLDWDHNVLTRQAKGRRVSLGEPGESLALLKPLAAVSHGGGERFKKDSDAYKRMLGWIQAGAPPARDDDAVVERIEVLPASVTLPQDGAQQLLVLAHYSDGSSEDVSAWAKFSTNADTVMSLGEDGRVKIVGPGSGGVTVWYASKVASMDVIAPRDVPAVPEVYAKAVRNNYIDDLVLAKLEQLRIAPAGEAGDLAFIRRAYLDTLGILPTPEEVIAFRDSQDPKKRGALIDAILERPEFVDYWSYKWCDLFLVSSKNLPVAGELSSFYRFIRRSVANNEPWDQFARDVITATGNTLENGAAAYYVMHKEVTNLSETTSQAFLGMSVTCARCHNHPLEKWTQDQYYGMANLFARVKLKAGNGGGTVVQANTSGDVLHPRRGAPMPPQPLDGVAMTASDRGDRRAVLASWLTSPDNPYFARSIANRLWRNFMGRGIVEPEDDLRATNPPSNPALLDALAKDLVEHRFDLKSLMRAIMNSAAYQRASAPPDPKHPDDTYYSYYIPRRLKAEVLLDVYAQATGVPTAFGGYPDGYRALQLRDSLVASYFLTAFGRPLRNQTCSCERTEDASIAQTLHLANGETLNNKLRGERSIVHQYVTAGITDTDLANRLWMRVLGHYPNADELAPALDTLKIIPEQGKDAATSRREAVEDLAWAVMTSKEFVFNH